MQRFEAPTPEQLRVHQHRIGQQRVRGDGAPVEGALVDAPVDISVDDLNLATLQVCASNHCILYRTIVRCSPGICAENSAPTKGAFVFPVGSVDLQRTFLRCSLRLSARLHVGLRLVIQTSRNYTRIPRTCVLRCVKVG